MRIAIITHAFPPSSHANGKRPYYMAQGLLDAGWDVDVYSSNLACSRGFEEALSHDKLRIIRVVDPVVKWLELVKPFRFIYKLAVTLTNGVIWPDFYAYWSRRVIKLISRDTGYDRVLAFVFPPSVYLSAKRRALIDSSWTFDLQESVSPQYRIVPRRSPLQKRRLPQLVNLEKLALQQAGRVVYTAATNQKAYIDQELVSQGKTEQLPYFYDAKVFDLSNQEVGELFEICYFGTFDWSGSRSPKTFLTSLAGFLAQHPNARARTRFSFYGNWLSEHDAIIKELGLEDVVNIQLAVPYEKYLKLVLNAPVLLLVISAEHNLFMPSKIVDYFGAARPILAYVPRDSEMRSVLEEAGMAEQAMDEADVEGGIKALDSLWQSYTNGFFESMDANTEFWSSKVQIPRYVDLLKQLPTVSQRPSQI